jgi:hypothetical protein
MRKRKGLVALVAVAAVVGLFVFVPWRLHAPPRCRINRAGFDQIQNGMQRAEVQAILGGPEGIYVSAKTREVIPTEKPWPVPGCFARYRREDWWSEQGRIEVYFKPDGTVGGKTFWEVRTVERSWTECIQRWLNW